MDVIFTFFLVVFVLILSVLPWILPLISNKVYGMEKFIWFLAGFFASWIGFLVFYYVVVAKKRPEYFQSETVYKSENGIKRDDTGRVIR
ncbi:MAG: hypothetical protein OCD00_11160 [Colwellia sp.]